MLNESYEDQYSAPVRQLRRITRAVRWACRGVLGRPRTLLVELRWRLGDEIMALPVLDKLRATYPRDTLVVLSNYPELFEGQAFIDQVNGNLPRVDRYLLLRGAPRQTHRLTHYAHCAGVDLPAMRPQVQCEDWASPGFDRDGSGPCIAVAAGASWRTKRWKKERWVGLCEAFLERGAHVVALGESGEEIGVGQCLVGKTTVREAAAVLRQVDLLVCCDSGLMRLARAVGTPVVALFGPTDPDILIRDDSDFMAIRSNQECSGFWNTRDEVPKPGICPWDHGCCLESISVEEVLDAVGSCVALPR